MGHCSIPLPLLCTHQGSWIGRTSGSGAFGGKAGATEGAGKLLAKGIGLIPWWYTTPSTDPRAEPVMKASRGFFNNYSLHWMGGTGGSGENNNAWVELDGGGGAFCVFQTPSC